VAAKPNGRMIERSFNYINDLKKFNAGQLCHSGAPKASIRVNLSESTAVPRYLLVNSSINYVPSGVGLHNMAIPNMSYILLFSDLAYQTDSQAKKQRTRWH
jgi:hypothetical protein